MSHSSLIIPCYSFHQLTLSCWVSLLFFFLLLSEHWVRKSCSLFKKIHKSGLHLQTSIYFIFILFSQLKKTWRNVNKNDGKFCFVVRKKMLTKVQNKGQWKNSYYIITVFHVADVCSVSTSAFPGSKNLWGLSGPIFNICSESISFWVTEGVTFVNKVKSLSAKQRQVSTVDEWVTAC